MHIEPRLLIDVDPRRRQRVLGRASEVLALVEDERDPVRGQALEIVGALAMAEGRWSDALATLEALSADEAFNEERRSDFLIAAGDILVAALRGHAWRRGRCSIGPACCGRETRRCGTYQNHPEFDLGETALKRGACYQPPHDEDIAECGDNRFAGGSARVCGPRRCVQQRLEARRAPAARPARRAQGGAAGAGGAGGEAGTTGTAGDGTGGTAGGGGTGGAAGTGGGGGSV